ncbi:MAG: HAMP domain-containing protein [Planctomycetes bacterium]|nr:HAMP domain-containing protein [Planctomycetota bacterium]
MVIEALADLRRGRLPLAWKLCLGLALVGLGMVAFLQLSLGPHATRAFRERSEVLIASSSRSMREMSADDIAQSTELLTGLIEHTTDARSRTLADLPLSLYAGDVEALRTALRERDDARGARQRDNVAILAREMERRTAARIDAEVGRLQAEQEALAATFAAGLRRQHLLLTGSVLAALVVLLGVGLYRLVVLPVRRLSRATQAVARGELDVTVAVRSRDEVGVLAGNFAGMLGDLRRARAELSATNAELARWNETLEREVARKTAHLQEAQGQLVQAARMASVGTLAGGVAHEFGNLIAGIRGCAAEALQDAADAEQREPLEVIVRAADRAGEMTRDLLRFARRELEPERDVDVAEVAREALALLEPHARRLHVRVSAELAAGAIVRGDVAGLHQVFVNLGTNALQAMPDGGTLRVAVAADPAQVRIDVEDTGCGIAPEHLASIFDPFFTTRDRESDPFRRGTGLGLAVTYGVVEAHGGRIEVHSEPGAGARFTVLLPRRGRGREAAEPQERAQ